jgi:hypothetical protein
MDADKDTDKDTKQAATSVVAGTSSTPGAIHVDESSMEGHQSEIVKKDDGSKTRSRALLGTGIVVILLLAIVVGLFVGNVIGTRREMLGDAGSPNTDTVAVPAATPPTTSSVPTSSVPLEAHSETPSLRPSPTPIVASSVPSETRSETPSLRPSPTPTVASSVPSETRSETPSLRPSPSLSMKASQTPAITPRLTILFDLFVEHKVSMQALLDLSSPQYAALDWMTNNDSADLQSTLSDDQLVERFFVVLLYFATDGASWVDQAGFLTSSLNTCAWRIVNNYSANTGVGCNDAGSVELLRLPHNNLNGQIPSELGQLSSLETLGFRGNNLNGRIPSELGQLSRLDGLDLSANALTGQIPSELGLLSRVQTFQLHYNALTGRLPSELGELSSAVFLFLHFNAMTGPIPTELGQISNLLQLFLYSNALTGQIPSELGQISSLQLLWLGGNDFTGTLPGELDRFSDVLNENFTL